MHYNKKSMTQLAEVLNRSKSSISRELRRNTGENGYSAYEAQNSYTTRRQACKPQQKVMKSQNHKYIISGLEQY
jgi:IS30 family transposase